MDCELCGKTATAKGRVEGVELFLCTACAKHSTGVKQLPQAQKAKPSVPVTPESPKEELVETVRPDIAKLLRQHREKLKLNHEQFAAKLQIRASTYNHYENGAATPSIEVARKLEHVLGVPLVVHVKVQTTPGTKQESQGMILGDFFKKR